MTHPDPSLTHRSAASGNPACEVLPSKAMPQIESLRDSYSNALVVVMGDDSEQSRQNAQYLQWAFDSLLFAFCEGGGSLTEEVLREVFPAETLRLAIDVNWIPYLDDQGDPLPEKKGDVDVPGYGVARDLYAAFLRLLPIEAYVEYAKEPWVHPTPDEIVTEVLDELGWKKMQLVEQMQVENSTQYTVKTVHNSGVKTTGPSLVLPQDAKERHGLDQLLTPPFPNTRRNVAQADHRTTLLKVIRKHSTKYATLGEHELRWRRP